jgi:hypothetical protein
LKDGQVGLMPKGEGGSGKLNPWKPKVSNLNTDTLLVSTYVVVRVRTHIVLTGNGYLCAVFGYYSVLRIPYWYAW